MFAYPMTQELAANRQSALRADAAEFRRVRRIRRTPVTHRMRLLVAGFVPSAIRPVHV
jgi:hypothetical protein